MRYKVYIWEFSSLDYLLDVLISWSCGLGVYNWFCPHLHLSGFISDFGFWIWFGSRVLLLISAIIVVVPYSPLVQYSVYLLLFHSNTLPDSCYILCLSYCAYLLTCFIAWSSAASKFSIYIYRSLLSCLTWDHNTIISATPNACLCTPLDIIFCTHWVVFWQPWTWISRSPAWTVVDFQ